MLDIRAGFGGRRGLRITANHKKSYLPQPNNGDVTLYNLPEEDRAVLTKAAIIKVALLAGYRDDLRQVCVMDIKQADNNHETTEWITKLEGADGGAAWANAHANVSFGKNSKITDVALGLVDKVGKRLTGFSIEKLQQAAGGKVFRHGYAANGNAFQELSSICAQLGLEVSIQDDEIAIVKRGGVEPTRDIFEWGPETGLLGSPRYAGKYVLGKPQLIEAKGLLNPVLKVHGKINLAAEAHAGEYVLRELDHALDTDVSGPWETKLHGLPLGGAT